MFSSESKIYDKKETDFLENGNVFQKTGVLFFS